MFINSGLEIKLKINIEKKLKIFFTVILFRILVQKTNNTYDNSTMSNTNENTITTMLNTKNPECPKVPQNWKEWTPELCKQWLMHDPVVKGYLDNAFDEKLEAIMFSWWGKWSCYLPYCGLETSIHISASNGGHTVQVYFCYD